MPQGGLFYARIGLTGVCATAMDCCRRYRCPRRWFCLTGARFALVPVVCWHGHGWGL